MRRLAMVVALVAAYLLLAGHPASWPGVVRSCLAVLALVAGIGVWGKRGVGSGEVLSSRRKATWLDYTSIGMAVLALECVFLVFLTLSPGPLESAAEGVGFRMRPEAEEGGSSPRSSTGNWLWDDSRHRPLPLRTDLKPGNRPEVFLQPSAPPDAEAMLASRLYVRAFALDRYGDSSWSVEPGGERPLLAENDGWLRLGRGRPGRSISCRVYLGGGKGERNPLTGIQGLTAARVDRVESLGEGFQFLPGNEGGHEYDTISTPLEIGELEGEELRVPDAVSGSGRELPVGDLGERIRRLALEVAGEDGPYRRLEGILGHLSETCGYSLVTENPDGRDPLENFLFYERRGHCELYATAAALLARGAGIPARVAYGWVGGTYYEGSGLFVFRAREAHAWTEVLLEGYGWVVLDATPRSATGGPHPEVAPPDEETPAVAELDAPDEPLSVTGPPIGRAGYALTGILAAGGVLLFAWRARTVGGRAGVGDPVSGGRGGGYLEAFLSRCRQRGIGVGQGRTLRRVVASLDDEPEFARDLVRYHYGVRYEGREPEDRVERELASRIDAWGRNGPD